MAHYACNGADVYNFAVLLRNHLPAHHLRSEHSSGEVDVNHPAQLVLGKFLCRMARRDGRRIDKCVDAPLLVHDTLHHSFNGRLVCLVQLVTAAGKAPFTQAVCKGLRPAGHHVRHHHMGAVFRKALGKVAAKAPCARDKHYFSLHAEQLCNISFFYNRFHHFVTPCQLIAIRRIVTSSYHADSAPARRHRQRHGEFFAQNLTLAPPHEGARAAQADAKGRTAGKQRPRRAAAPDIRVFS